MNIGVVGSREFPLGQKHLIVDFINSLPEDTVVISGGARGVDKWAENASNARRLGMIVFLPEWDKYGKRAGFIRNQTIVNASDEIVCFWDGVSRGSMDTVRRAREAGKKVTIIKSEYHY